MYFEPLFNNAALTLVVRRNPLQHGLLQSLLTLP
jgi:hypothetical protein